MKVALSHWQGRIAPVFDVAADMLLVDVESGRELQRDYVVLHQQEPSLRAQEVASHGVNVLICGGISAYLERSLSLCDVRVIGFLCGSVSKIMEAFLQERLIEEGTLVKQFAMPGCRGWQERQRFRKRGNRIIDLRGHKKPRC